MKVSIVMPVYNSEEFIQESIESILRQEQKAFELIIINDGSTDKTHECIQPYLQDNRLRYFDVGKVGKIEAFNRGYQEASSNFICFFTGFGLLL